MKLKNVIYTLLASMLSVTLLAQTNPGLDLFKLGELELAKQHFMKQLRQQPADAYYYLGEIAWEQGKFDEARDSYKKAMNSNPESLYSQVGAAKGELSTFADKNSREAKEVLKTLDNLFKKNRSDTEIMLEIAKAYYDNNLEQEGDKVINEAKKRNLKNPFIYILLGDRLMKQEKNAEGKETIGDAARQYDQAIGFEPTNMIALIKVGKVYEYINSSIAIQNFKTAMEQDPSNTLINRYLAKVYSTSGQYPSAIAMYKDYFAQKNYNLEDIRYYSNALYFSEDYETARKILKEGVDREKDNFVFNRLLMYVEKELNNSAEGMAVGDHFFNLRDTESGGYIDKDYMAYGHLLAANGKNKEALDAYNKAIEMNPDNVNLFRELASSMATDKLYAEAAQFMNNYISAMGEDADAQDYSQLGRYYQSAGQALTDSLPEVVAQRMEFIKKADQAYQVVTERLPDNFMGYYMRAGANTLLDPELRDGLAKPFYEKAIEIIKANDEVEQRKTVILTAYEYLAIFYFYRYDDSKSTEDKDKALYLCESYIELNPDRANINQIKEILESQ